MDFPSNDSYFSLLNLSFVENCHISIFTTFAKQSMINRLSNSINRNRSAAKISKVMSSSQDSNLARNDPDEQWRSDRNFSKSDMDVVTDILFAIDGTFSFFDIRFSRLVHDCS